ncbi:3D domain-containing protein [Liquorilactobacillus vini]|uniref:3D domain-containing protein n=1 Tax=Liquorilactobacillus vini TaxID=238015 RepID=UPI00029ABCAF|nr:3D domain-containing protein [Liquorilactobacillus vini]
MREQGCKTRRLKFLLIILTFVGLSAINQRIMADKIGDLQQQESTAKNKLDQNNNQLAAKVASVNSIYQQLTKVNQRQKITERKLIKTNQELQRAKSEKKQRMFEAKQRLRQLQQKKGTQSGLSFLENSKGFSQWVGNLMALSKLQAVYNESFAAVKQSVLQLTTSKKQLSMLKAQQSEQAKELAIDKSKMSESINSLKQMIADNQNEIKLLANKVTWAKNMLAKQQAAQSSTSASQQTSNQIVKQTSSLTTGDQNQSSAQSTSNSTDKVNNSNGKSLTMQATGYSSAEAGASNYSALGINLSENPKCVAVDPSVIPLGSLLWVSGYGVAVAGDTGGAIKGNLIDLHFSSVQQASSWGRKTVTVKILN